jgi:dehydrogenase/reductase SDR family protein 7
MIGVPLSASYAGSKWAIHGYMNSIKAEMPWLRIDLICPGPVDTSFHSNKDRIDITNNSQDSNKELGNKDKKKLKMSVKRCTQLYLSSLLHGTKNKAGGEYWIAEQPTLLGLYINQYFPGLFQTLLSKIGPFRVQAWEDGKDLYDPDTWKNSRKKQ